MDFLGIFSLNVSALVTNDIIIFFNDTHLITLINFEIFMRSASAVVDVGLTRIFSFSACKKT